MPCLGSSPSVHHADPLRRVHDRPCPTEWDDEEPITLQEAVALFFPMGPLTLSSFRTEIRKGNLRAVKRAGRWFVTPAAVRSLFELQQWVGRQRELGSICEPAGPIPGRDAQSPRSTSSAMDKRTSALAAARTALEKLKRS